MPRDCLAAGMLGYALLAAAAAAQPLPKPCFTISVELKVWGTDHSEEHRFQGSYRPGRMGDIGIRTRDGTQESCNIAAISAGDSRRFFLTDLKGSATGRHGTSTGSVRQDRLTEQDRDSYVTVTRKGKGATLEFSASSPLPGSDDCAECFGATAMTDFKPSVFELSEDDLKNLGVVNKSVTLRAARNDDGYQGAGKATLNATLTPDEEMIFVTTDAYQAWLPAPMPELLPGVTVTPAASRLRIAVKIQPKQSGEARQGKIQFELQEVTRHKGRTGNYPPNGSEKDDLKFADEQPEGVVLGGPKSAHTTEAVPEATVVIEALDTAAWGRLTAKAPDLDLKAIDKATNTYSLTIPRDTDGNRIADAWEGRALDPQADDEKVEGQDRAGDGMTAIDEYRGLIVLVDGKKELRRFSPRVKEMFIIDPGGLFDAQRWKEFTQLEAYKVDDSLVKGGGDEIESRLVNFNGPDSAKSKYAVRLVKLSVGQDPDGAEKMRIGYTHCGYCTSATDCDKCKSPKDARSCNIIPERAPMTVEQLYAKLEKAVADPASPEAVEMALAGLPPFLAPRALERMRSPMVRAQMAEMLLRQAVIHEVGHAVGLADHDTDPPEELRQQIRSCPMYYPGRRAWWRFTLLQSLFKPDASMPMQYSLFCRGLAGYSPVGYNCYSRINVADW